MKETNFLSFYPCFNVISSSETDLEWLFCFSSPAYLASLPLSHSKRQPTLRWTSSRGIQERRQLCLTCSDHVRGQTFVPVDIFFQFESLPFTPEQQRKRQCTLCWRFVQLHWVMSVLGVFSWPVHYIFISRLKEKGLSRV